MALLFSAVRATARDQEVEFFVGGIPREYDDLEGWTAFDRFMEDIDEETDVLWHYSVEAHPGLVNMFVDRVQKEWQTLGLFNRTHCTDEGDYEGRLIVMKPSSLKDRYKTPEFQLFYATGGFGCSPTKIGTQVAPSALKNEEFGGST